MASEPSKKCEYCTMPVGDMESWHTAPCEMPTPVPADVDKQCKGSHAACQHGSSSR